MPNFLSPQVLLTLSSSKDSAGGLRLNIQHSYSALRAGCRQAALSFVEGAFRGGATAAPATLHHSCCIVQHEYYNAGMQSFKLPPAKCQMPVKNVVCERINKGHPSQWSVTFLYLGANVQRMLLIW